MRRPGGRPLSFKEWTKRFCNEQGEFIGSKVVEALNEGGRGRDATIKFCAHYGIGLPAKQTSEAQTGRRFELHTAFPLGTDSEALTNQAAPDGRLARARRP